MTPPHPLLVSSSPPPCIPTLFFCLPRLTPHYSLHFTHNTLFRHFQFNFLLLLSPLTPPQTPPLPASSYSLLPFSPPSLPTTTLSSCTTSPFYSLSSYSSTYLDLPLTIYFTTHTTLSLYLFFIFSTQPLFLFPSPFSNNFISIPSSSLHLYSCSLFHSPVEISIVTFPSPISNFLSHDTSLSLSPPTPPHPLLVSSYSLLSFLSSFPSNHYSFLSYPLPFSIPPLFLFLSYPLVTSEFLPYPLPLLFTSPSLTLPVPPRPSLHFKDDRVYRVYLQLFTLTQSRK